MSPKPTRLISVDDAEYNYSALGPIRCSRTPPRVAPYRSPTTSPDPSPSPSHLPPSSPPLTPCSMSNVPPNPSSGEKPSHSTTPANSRMKTRSQNEYPKVSVRFPTPGAAGLASDQAASVIASDEAAAGLTTDQPATPKIPKPEGENGRPGRGGYALKSVLGWGEKEYKKIQIFVRKLVETTLIVNMQEHIPFTSQPPEKLDIVREKMLRQFPRLADYEDNWASDDFIRAALKYRQTRVKTRKLQVQAAQGQALANMHRGPQ